MKYLTPTELDQLETELLGLQARMQGSNISKADLNYIDRRCSLIINALNNHRRALKHKSKAPLKIIK